MQDFTRGKVTKQLASFALPMLIGNIFQQVYSMVDSMVVGRFVSGKALAAVGTSDMAVNFFIAVLIGLTTGASVVISQYYGAKDEENLSKTVSTSLIFLLGLSIVISVAGVALTPLFLQAMQVPGDILGDAIAYFRIIVGGLSFSMVFNVYSAYLRALGDSKRPLYILIFASLLNLGLDFLFVVGLGWGVSGAAWATILSQGVSAVLCYFYAGHAVPVLKIKRLVFDWPLLRQVLRYSIPAAVQMSINSLASLSIVRLINSFGSSALAGYTAATKIDGFAMMPLSSISMAVSTFVAQNIGAGDEKRARKGLWTSMVMMLALGIVIPLFILIFKEHLLSLFVTAGDADYANIIQVGSDYLSVIVSFYVLFGVFFSFNGFFRGAGDAVIVMALTICSLTIRACSAYFMADAFSMGPEAVAWSIPIGWALCSLIAFLYYRSGRWKGKGVVRAVTEPTQTKEEKQ